MKKVIVGNDQIGTSVVKVWTEEDFKNQTGEMPPILIGIAYAFLLPIVVSTCFMLGIGIPDLAIQRCFEDEDPSSETLIGGRTWDPRICKYLKRPLIELYVQHTTPDGRLENWPWPVMIATLLHELRHVWQIERDIISMDTYYEEYDSYEENPFEIDANLFAISTMVLMGVPVEKAALFVCGEEDTFSERIFREMLSHTVTKTTKETYVPNEEKCK
ncbi:MAG: hypothetical protein K5852_07040 [Eubacterium sp.]|nr:hypothetical protein [Eubacterium sp.]